MKRGKKADRDLRHARKLWPNLSRLQVAQLQLVAEHHVFATDLRLLEGNIYVTHSGLLRIARRNHCNGIHTETVNDFCDPGASRWVIKATVYKSRNSRGFVGYGDADPSNVPDSVHGAEMRIAETRAVNRALRKAYGIGLCSVEELGTRPARMQSVKASAGRGDQNDGGQPRLRDRLLLLIREHQLNAEEVKRYATQYCGSKSLGEANRAQVEKLVRHLENLAAQGRETLLHEINGSDDSSAATKEAA